MAYTSTSDLAVDHERKEMTREGILQMLVEGILQCCVWTESCSGVTILLMDTLEERQTGNAELLDVKGTVPTPVRQDR